MLRGWGASSGTQTWNARLDPAVGWLSPLPRPPPSQPPGAQVNRETTPFQGEEGKLGQMEQKTKGEPVERNR